MFKSRTIFQNHAIINLRQIKFINDNTISYDEPHKTPVTLMPS